MNSNILKDITWRIIGSFITALITYIILQDVKVVSIIILIEVITKMIAYYFHERSWNRIQRGRDYKENRIIIHKNE
ncbi:DUF2061 domain-containing protein [Acetohalobium arabaticum]|uniref:DUF2061 domain-containing protein n=1 Tax=Acetohalobium arabaticum (strain ATCC 49924 / DSM 5501 / Z-7288) TaxID=574087 RepID=D9QTC0_ACEAZ|nr:DUF2061 domain-containing protein [Acetohalobium arabaticum]ADL13620.1 Protein of unknown function DUF2061, membrane [Acetohalobium arabaticum DSM 5501]